MQQNNEEQQHAAMIILLTGCAGFIGSHTLDRLLLDGHSVIGVDNYDPYYPRALKDRNVEQHLADNRFVLVEGDLTETETYQKITLALAQLNASAKRNPKHALTEELASSEIGAVIHLAAKAGVRPSILAPNEYQRANVFATQNLLDFAKVQKTDHFIFASSSSVYGINPNTPWTEHDNVLMPISPYASTKISCELLGHVYSHLYHMRFLSLRFFTVYGPRQRPDLAINKFTRLTMAGKPISIYGDGSTLRDYTYIDDIVNGITKALYYRESKYEVINLGNNNTTTLNDLITCIEHTVGRKALVDHLPIQPGDVPQTWADITKAKNMLDYTPTTSLQDGINKFVEWHRNLIRDPQLKDFYYESR